MLCHKHGSSVGGWNTRHLNVWRTIVLHVPASEPGLGAPDLRQATEVLALQESLGSQAVHLLHLPVVFRFRYRDEDRLADQLQTQSHIGARYTVDLIPNTTGSVTVQLSPVGDPRVLPGFQLVLLHRGATPIPANGLACGVITEVHTIEGTCFSAISQVFLCMVGLVVLLCGLVLEETGNGLVHQKARRSTVHVKNLQ